MESKTDTFMVFATKEVIWMEEYTTILISWGA